MQRGRSISPLHFAAAASWSEGVKTLISMGYSRFQADGNGETPLDIAIEVKCTPAVEFLLAGDCLELLASSEPNLPSQFRKAAKSDDSHLHDIIVTCLSRHIFLLPMLLPYHYLAYRNWRVYYYYRNHHLWRNYYHWRDYHHSADFGASIKFAHRLFLAGFQDIDAYNDYGYTPLMVACGARNLEMASFLLEHGADPYKCHEHVDLRAGHFLCYDTSSVTRKFYFGSDPPRFKDVEKRLLKMALDTSVDIGSRCRCSPDGLSPITTFFHIIDGPRVFDNTRSRKMKFEDILENIDSSFTDRKKYWRAFVVSETFCRLGMTHTCVKLKDRIQPFPDNKRIEIEDEEEDLFSELEEIVARFDLFSENFGDDLSRCVDEFIDDLDGDIRVPGQFECNSWSYGAGKVSDDVVLGEASVEGFYVSMRGRIMAYGHKETVKEESMLHLLFS
jgi:hypothetical protein